MDDAQWREQVVQRITHLETCVTQLCDNDIPHMQRQLGDISKAVTANGEDITWVKGRMNRGTRPTWGVTLVLAGLLAAAVGMAVKLIGG